MRIIGGKDYYDHGLAYGVDQSVVFMRTGGTLVSGVPGVTLPSYAGASPTIVTPDNPQLRKFWLRSPGARASWTWKNSGYDYKVESVRVVFCGYYYGGARVSWKSDLNQRGYGLAPGESIQGEWLSQTFWDQNTLGKFLAARGAGVKTGEHSAGRRQPASQPEYSSKEFARFKLQGEYLRTVLDHGVVVATQGPEDVVCVRLPGRSSASDQPSWTVNCDTLKEYDFIKVMDPVKAFQEIAMWVGGVLPKPGNPTVQITDDKIKLAKHGMDATSFRRPPQKNRG